MVPIGVIQEYVDRVAARFRPRRIILFGSHAYGTPDSSSDVDLLVVMPDGGDPLGASIRVTREVDHRGFPLDLIVRDPEDLRRRVEGDDYFMQEVVRRGKVLYEADDSRMGAEGGDGLAGGGTAAGGG